MQEDIRQWSWEKRAPAFYDAFREVLASDPRAPATIAAREVPDLCERVTVFVTTVGAKSYQACRDHLAEQDCRFRLEIIDRVAPMNAAFQRMLEDCATPFFIQVDEDMLLYPQAVRTLCEKISSAAPNVAIFFADLHDAHLGRSIVGVKIYRHDIVRRYPFADVQSFEKQQVRRLRADGYEVGFDRRSQVLGLHGTHWTPESIFERYATLESRRRRHPIELAWFSKYHSVFLSRFLEDPSDLNFFALMGVVAGATPSGQNSGDKDFRAYAALPGLDAARKLFAELHSQGEPRAASFDRPAPARAAAGSKSRRSG
jgi:hypothetical protein